MTARSTKNGPLLGTYIFRQCLAVFCLLSSLGGKQSSLSLVSAQSCIDNFYEIYEKEALVTDTTFNRLYIICPRRIYEIATLDFNGNIREPQSSGVFPPLPLRSNITIRCGDQGSREDLCWLTGGDLHMDGTNVLGLAEETIENVSIEGFVFIGARKHSLWAAKPGSIFFRDCEWKDFVNSQVPIMLDYYDVLNPSKKLVTTFSDCEFRVSWPPCCVQSLLLPMWWYCTLRHLCELGRLFYFCRTIVISEWARKLLSSIRTASKTQWLSNNPSLKIMTWFSTTHE